MTIGPIKTEADYQGALHRIDRLIHCTDDSKQADELNERPMLVENYESKH